MSRSAVSPGDNCEVLAKAVGWTGAIALPLHTLPYFFCASAVFLHKRLAVTIFAISWLCTVAGGLASPFFLHGMHSDRTSLCVMDADIEYAVGIVATAVYNSMLFFSVTIRMMMYISAERWSVRVKLFFRGQNAAEASGLVMQSGQMYLMCVDSLSASWILIILTFTPS